MTDIKIYEKLSLIQNELVAPKGQYNKFGGYKYRSAEDILNAVKPLCAKNRCTLILTDEVLPVNGHEETRFYVIAKAVLYDWDSESTIEVQAMARESISKKGMDDSQITGTASSYARKYAMNGLFNIDDSKDADTDAYTRQTKPNAIPKDMTLDQMKHEFTVRCNTMGIDAVGLMMEAGWDQSKGKASKKDYENAFKILEDRTK